MPEEKSHPIGQYGRLRLNYLKHHCRVLYANLKTTYKLQEHLAEVDLQASQMFNLITLQMAQAEGVTEELKSRDQMAWVGAMNSIKNRAEEIVFNEIIYA